MSRPHPLLVELAAGRPLPAVDSDHDELVRSAFDHRVDGLLLSAVRNGDVRLDDDAVARLTEAELLRRVHQQRLWATLENVVAVAGDLGIRLATVKGVVLQRRWYDGDFERDCGDLDVLLGPDDWGRAGELVTALQPDHPLGAWIGPMATSHKQQSVELRVDGVSVDLHFDVLKLGVASNLTTEIWKRTTPFMLPSGAEIGVLEPEAELLHLLMHLNKDRFGQLQGLVDVARLIDRGHPSWGDVMSLAAVDGLEVPVVESRGAVDCELGRGASVEHAHGARAWLWRQLWSPSVRLQGGMGVVRYRYRQAWLPWTMRGRAWDTARWWARKPFPDPVLARYRNPDVRGGYVAELAFGRIRRWRERHHTIADLRANKRVGHDR
jgi:hypothetical protein